MGVTIQEDMYEAAEFMPPEQRQPFIAALVAFGMSGVLPDEGEPWYPTFHVCRRRLEMSAKRSKGGRESVAKRWANSQDEGTSIGTYKDTDEGTSIGTYKDTDEGTSIGTYIGTYKDTDEGTYDRCRVGTYDRCRVGTYDTEVRRGENEVRMRSGEESPKRIESGTDDGGSPMPDGPVPYGAIVGRLNQRAGADYRPSSRATRRLIDARWREGYRLPDFEAVVDAKCSEWAGTEMAKYLRPQTLFGTKFEAYRSQASMDRGGGAPDGWYDFASLDAE